MPNWPIRKSKPSSRQRWPAHVMQAFVLTGPTGYCRICRFPTSYQCQEEFEDSECGRWVCILCRKAHGRVWHARVEL